MSDVRVTPVYLPKRMRSLVSRKCNSRLLRGEGCPATGKICFDYRSCWKCCIHVGCGIQAEFQHTCSNSASALYAICLYIRYHPYKVLASFYLPWFRNITSWPRLSLPQCASVRITKLVLFPRQPISCRYSLSSTLSCLEYRILLQHS
jgi:hypothetical protein